VPYAQSAGVKLYYEEAGQGYPIVFVHEFGSDHREWETQIRWFSREYRCIAYNARGYPPSDVPENDEAYGYRQATDDIAAVMRHLGIAQAHVVGLSMGGYATLMFGLRHPAMASALVVAGCGSGAPRAEREAFKARSLEQAEQFLKQGSAKVAPQSGVSPTRVQLQIKDPRGWDEFVRHLSEHSAKGSALTMRNYQALRPSLWDFEAELTQLAVPTLIVVGDEDNPCIEPSVFLKRMIRTAGLWVFPRTGHAVNLEEPGLFNRVCQDFFGSVERGRWGPRDPRTIDPAYAAARDR
jgi:pimeloyl-ACP methyl ester carboxylesterase